MKYLLAGAALACALAGPLLATAWYGSKITVLYEEYGDTKTTLVHEKDGVCTLITRHYDKGDLFIDRCEKRVINCNNWREEI